MDTRLHAVLKTADDHPSAGYPQRSSTSAGSSGGDVIPGGGPEGGRNSHLPTAIEGCATVLMVAICGGCSSGRRWPCRARRRCSQQRGVLRQVVLLTVLLVVVGSGLMRLVG